MNRFERPQMNNPSKQALTMMLRQRNPTSFMNAGNNPQQSSMSGLPFNVQQAAQRQQFMRTGPMRNINPAQIAAASGSNQINTNLPNALMSGGSMVQQRQTQQVTCSFI